MTGTFEATGGARVGWTNATWPLAKLTATPTSLRVAIRVLGDYNFTPDTVVSITRYSMIPIFGWGIKIEHCVPEYPARFIFWCLGRPDTLLAGIRESGFLPQAPASAMVPRRGFALRWQAIVVAVVAWNGLFMLNTLSHRQISSAPGPLPALTLGIAFAAALAVIRVPALQRLVLKPGRSIGEIRPFLKLLLLITGILFVAFSLIAVFQ